MFEFSLIRKYLIPKRRQLSVSIIAFISVFVIALVVWLVLVFLSVTDGMEKKWTEKLIALTAPVQITPTDSYYQSYYYQIDSISTNSDYTHKTIGEKLNSPISDPYNPEIDIEPLSSWSQSVTTSDGALKNLVKEAFDSINSIKGYKNLAATDFEVTISNARIRLLRSSQGSGLGQEADMQNFLTQISYVASFDPGNKQLQKTFIDPDMRDLSNIFSMLSLSSTSSQADRPKLNPPIPQSAFQKRIKSFNDHVTITHLKTGPYGYKMSRNLLPEVGSLKACIVLTDDVITRFVIPKETKHLSNLIKGFEMQGLKSLEGILHFDQNQISFDDKKGNHYEISDRLPLVLEANALLEASLMPASVDKAHYTGHLQFSIDSIIQNLPLKGNVYYQDFEIGRATFQTSYSKEPESSPFWLYHVQNTDKTRVSLLPSDSIIGNAILLPKTFKDNGVLLGDQGYLSYYTTTTSSSQEQRIPIFIAGFYDPGLIPIGSKLLLAPKTITSLISSSVHLQDSFLGNGINIWFDNFKRADKLKEQLTEAFKERGIAPYWQIKTYREYEFTKDFIEQISSDKTLYTLIAIIIILVACTNVISMLILLVNDKKQEIGILQAMGASPKSIAAIFGLCGVLIGLISSCIGTLAAIFTLKHIDYLVSFLSHIQGHQAFNPAYFGDALPKELSTEALIFVLIATATMSLLAGLIPAIKASGMFPTKILRN